MIPLRSLPLAAALLAVSAAPAAAIRAPRIVKGDAIAIAALPSTVSLVQAGYAEPDGHFCGGSVIAPDAVLTAAHCVVDSAPGDVAVVSGRTRLSDATTGTRTAVSQITIDPRYTGYGHDAAVLRLAAPVAVPPATLGAQMGTSAVVAGWGLTSTHGDISDVLRAVTIPFAGDAACRRQYGSGFKPATMICAGGDGRDSCSGDSGGPLIASNRTLIGLVSYGGERCGAPGEPAVYARVSAEQPWIASVLTGAAAIAAARISFGRMACGSRSCRVDLKVTGNPAGITVSARGVSVAARRLSATHWRAIIDLPDGRYAITAAPQTADGRPAGRTAKVRVEVG